MSAVTKPFFKSSSSTTPTKAIPVEDVVGSSSVDLPLLPILGVQRFQYLIIFAMRSDAMPRNEVLEYATSALRNTAYSAFLTAFATNV